MHLYLVHFYVIILETIFVMCCQIYGAILFYFKMVLFGYAINEERKKKMLCKVRDMICSLCRVYDRCFIFTGNRNFAIKGFERSYSP